MCFHLGLTMNYRMEKWHYAYMLSFLKRQKHFNTHQ
jgi:hypothetical protein